MVLFRKVPLVCKSVFFSDGRQDLSVLSCKQADDVCDIGSRICAGTFFSVGTGRRGPVHDARRELLGFQRKLCMLQRVQCFLDLRLKSVCLRGLQRFLLQLFHEFVNAVQFLPESGCSAGSWGHTGCSRCSGWPAAGGARSGRSLRGRHGVPCGSFHPVRKRARSLR